MFSTTAANIAAQRQMSMFEDDPAPTGHPDLFAAHQPDPGPDPAPQVFALQFEDGARATIPAALDCTLQPLTKDTQS